MWMSPDQGDDEIGCNASHRQVHVPRARTRFGLPMRTTPHWFQAEAHITPAGYAMGMAGPASPEPPEWEASSKCEFTLELLMLHCVVCV